jgi:hypothetical protein
MNISLIISSIIGGLLMLAMIGLNTRVSQNAGQKTMQFATKAKVEAISAYITADLRQVGAGITTSSPITQIGEHNLAFRRIGANGSQETVRWVWNPTVHDLVSPNPRDRKLYRIAGNDTTDFGSGIVSFRYRYLTATGDSTLTPSAVRRIRVRMIVESNVSYMDEWARSYWETDITPRSLQN